MPETLRPLVEAARAGDPEALNTLAACVDRFVRVFSGSVSRNLRRSSGSTIDFVLEGLAEALARLDEFEFASDEAFYAWAGRHIRHRIADAGRREGREKRAGRPVALGDLDKEIAASDPSVSRIVADEEVRQAVGRILVGIQLEHPLEMEAVVLKVFDGLSWPELKDALDLSSEKRARTLFARGLDLLRPRLEAQLGDEVLREFLRM